MKISYRTHPVLKFFQNEMPGIDIPKTLYDSMVKCGEWAQFERSFYRTWDLLKDDFCKNINLVTAPFFDAVKTNIEKLIVSELYKELGSHGGVILYKNVSFCYHMERASGKLISATILLFNGSGLEFYGNKDNIHICNPVLLSNYNTKDAKVVARKLFCAIESIILFKQFAKVEICELPPSKKVKAVGCKYVNETSAGINILDSKWFTTLVKSDAFKVRGHFRLQPCGQGLKDRKLIWINEFEKEGYIAPARKLNSDL